MKILVIIIELCYRIGIKKKKTTTWYSIVPTKRRKSWSSVYNRPIYINNEDDATNTPCHRLRLALFCTVKQTLLALCVILLCHPFSNISRAASHLYATPRTTLSRARRSERNGVRSTVESNNIVSSFGRHAIFSYIARPRCIRFDLIFWVDRLCGLKRGLFSAISIRILHFITW